jgi:hypothetical protein
VYYIRDDSILVALVRSSCGVLEWVGDGGSISKAAWVRGIGF